MLGRLVNYLRRPGLFHPVLALVLLLSLTQDPGHQHISDGNSQLCYACHFTPDLSPAVQASGFRPFVQPARFLRAAATHFPPRHAVTSYDARGPPLLS